MSKNLKHTLAAGFFNDPRIKEAKDLIAQTITDHQKKITAIKNAPSMEAEAYDKIIKELSQNRGGNLFYRYIGSGFGNGPFVELCDGSIKYDFITGIGVHYFGHTHKDVILASVEGALENTPMQGHLQQNFSSHELIKLLLQQANKYNAKMSHVILSSSGAMANENAIKIAFQKRSPASRVLAFEKCFSGRTLALSCLTDKPQFRQGLPKTIDVDYLPFFDEANPEMSRKKCVEILKKHLARYPKQHACFLFEPILGEAGSWAGNTEFFTEILTLMRNEGITIIADEVQSFGRTEELFAFQYYKLDELIDLVTIGKMSQVCATILREDHKPQVGLISQTFTSSSSAIHASLTILKKVTSENYLGPNGKIKKLSDCFRNHLISLSKKYPGQLEGPYGVGAMVAMTIFSGDAKKSNDFIFKLFDQGVLSFTAGADPTRVRFLIPAGAVTEEHINEVSLIIDKVMASLC